MREEYFKTKYEEISELANTDKCRTVLLKNADTGELAVKKEMPKEMFDVYSKLANVKDDELGIVKVYACFVEEDKCIDIEEYVNGKTLETVMNSDKYADKDYINFVINLCGTLSGLHQMGIIHRDIQPKNIIIENDRAKLIDFDIARNKKEDADKDTRLLGTPEYASPEAYGFSQTDERSDIFSLGKLLEHLIKDDRLKSIVEKCTEIDPDNRYQKVDELKEDLLVLAQGEQDKGTKSFIRTIPGFRKNKPLNKVIAVIVYVLVIITLTGTALQAKGNIVNKLLSVILFYLWIAVPYAFLMNVGNITDRVVRAKYKDARTKWLVRILLCAFSFILTSIVLGLFMNHMG